MVEHQTPGMNLQHGHFSNIFIISYEISLDSHHQGNILPVQSSNYNIINTPSTFQPRFTSRKITMR